MSFWMYLTFVFISFFVFLELHWIRLELKKTNDTTRTKTPLI